MEQERNSNIELLRIILMIMIIAHHYVVNSGITSFYDFSNITSNMLLLQIASFGGKLAINCFTLITGYFMIKTDYSIKKWLKLWLQVVFYNVLFSIFFLLIGKIHISGLKSFINFCFVTLCPMGFDANGSYIGSMLCFYLLMPIFQTAAKKISKKQYEIILLALLYCFSIIPTIMRPFESKDSSLLIWLCIMFFIGGYIRLYFPDSTKPGRRYRIFLSLIGALSMIIIMIGSIFFIDLFGAKLSMPNDISFLIGYNKLPTLFTSVFIFYLFLHIKIKNNKVINTLGSVSFGVLCIHANSDIMRAFLWNDLLNVSEYYRSSFLWAHLLISILLVYLVCGAIEYVRRNSRIIIRINQNIDNFQIQVSNTTKR